MTNESTKPPVWFWIVGAIALIWNAIGVMNYLIQAYMPEEALATLTPEQQAYYNSIPAWATAGFAIGVFAGTLACVMLLMRKKLAYLLFIASLLGVFVQNIHGFFIGNAMEAFGPPAVVLPGVVLLFGIYLIFLAKKGIARGWLS